MRRLFKYLSYGIKVAEFLSVAAAVMAFLLPSDITSLNHSYYYVLIVQHKVLVCLLLISIAFGPRIIGLVYQGAHFLNAYVENGAALAVAQNKRALLHLSNLILLAIAFAILASALLQFAYVEYKVLSNRSNLVRQAMIVAGANQEHDNKSSDAVATYRKILAMFPDDPRNSATERRISKIVQAIELSKLLSKRAELLANSQNMKLAYTLYKSAREIWKENSEADSGMKAIRGDLLEKLKRMATACNVEDQTRILEITTELAIFRGQKTQDARNIIKITPPQNLVKMIENECNTARATLKLEGSHQIKELERTLVFTRKISNEEG